MGGINDLHKRSFSIKIIPFNVNLFLGRIGQSIPVLPRYRQQPRQVIRQRKDPLLHENRISRGHGAPNNTSGFPPVLPLPRRSGKKVNPKGEVYQDKPPNTERLKKFRSSWKKKKEK